MPDSVPELPPLDHVGSVVRDLDGAAAAYARRLGLGPLDTVVDLTIRDALYHGDRVTFSARFGFLDLGGARLELIQPLEGRSPYADTLERDGEGPHHLAFRVPSIDPWVDSILRDDPQATVVLEARLPNDAGAFTYVEAGGGLLVELVALGG